jgi:hypothetical protein
MQFLAELGSTENAEVCYEYNWTTGYMDIFSLSCIAGVYLLVYFQPGLKFQPTWLNGWSGRHFSPGFL